MINVAYLLDSFEVGGTELHTIRTAEALDPARVRLHAVHIHRDGPLLSRYQALGIPMQHLPMRSLAGPDYFRAGALLRQTLRRWQVSVFHSHDLYGNMFGVPWARAAGVRAVIASRRWWDSTPRRSHRVVNRWTSRLAHYVTANSEAVGALVVREGVPAAKVKVFPNFIEDAAFAEPDAAWCRAQRDQLGVPRDALVIGTVGRLEPVKNHVQLLRALAALAPQPRPVHLVIVGDGSMRAMLEGLATELGVASRVHFAGARPSRPNNYQWFDVAAVVSRSEGFPNSLVEAMAAGCAAVATPVGGVVDALEDGVTGLLVGVDDVAATAAALGSLLGDAERRGRLAQAAREQARRRFAEGPVTDSLTTWYESLAG